MPEVEEAPPALADPAKMSKGAIQAELEELGVVSGTLTEPDAGPHLHSMKVGELRALLVETRAKVAASGEEVEEVEAEVVAEEDAGAVEPGGELVTAGEVEDEVGKAIALREQAVVASHALPTVAEYNVLGTLANRVYNTPFVPQSYRGNEASVFAAFLFGREIGLGPMMALRDIYMIDGRPALAAHRQLAKLREGGVVILESEATRERAYIKAQRRDTGEIMAVEFTFEEARLIMQKGKPLIDKDNWRNYPADMLWARALGRLTRRLGPDLTGGLPPYVAEEVADFSDWGVEYDESGAPTFRAAGAAPNSRRENEMQPPKTFAAVDAVVSHYGPVLGWREWLRDASELLFKTRDASELSVAQKTQLLQKASGACVALRDSIEPNAIPPVSREDVQKAWAHVLDGITLPGPPWRMSPDEEDRAEFVPEDDPAPAPAAAATPEEEPASEPGTAAVDDIEWPDEDPSGYGG